MFCRVGFLFVMTFRGKINIHNKRLYYIDEIRPVLNNEENVS